MSVLLLLLIPLFILRGPQVTVPAALLVLARDLWHDWHQGRDPNFKPKKPIDDSPPSTPTPPAVPNGKDEANAKSDHSTQNIELSNLKPSASSEETQAPTPSFNPSRPSNTRANSLQRRQTSTKTRPSPTENESSTHLALSSSSPQSASHTPTPTLSSPEQKRWSLPRILSIISARFPTFASVFKHLPFPLLVSPEGFLIFRSLSISA